MGAARPGAPLEDIQPDHGRVILHFDCDCFYAQVCGWVVEVYCGPVRGVAEDAKPCLCNPLAARTPTPDRYSIRTVATLWLAPALGA